MNDSHLTFDDKTISNLAYKSIVLGFLGCIAFGPITGIPAIIIGHKSLKRIKSNSSEHSDTERRLSKAGIILGYIAILMTLSIVIYFVQFFLDPHFFGNIKFF